MSLVANPFLLVLALQTLPGIIYGIQDLEGIVKDENACLRELSNANFFKVANNFLKDLATAIYTEQDGNPIVRYVHRDEKETWKVKYFGPDNTEATLLRNASPLTGSGVIHRFIHRSLLEYFFTFEEHEIHQLRTKRRQERDSRRQRVYVPLHAKVSLQDLEEERPLMEKVQEFLASERQVMLVLGDSGSGKSTFIHHLEHQLWANYKLGGPIPFFINLPAVDRPESDLIDKQLRVNNFNEDQIQELKLHRQLILICDGYDESQQLVNLHRTNMLNRPGQWNTKMIVSCRTQFLGPTYVDRFKPQPFDWYSSGSQGLFQEAVITPFSRDQVKSYVEQYAQDTEAALLFRNIPVWSAEEYMEKLTAIPNVMDLVKNPFMLTLALKALPDLFASNTNQARIRITRVELYDIIVDQWLETNRLRIEHNRLSPMDRKVFASLMDADFIQCGIDYLLRLAAAILKKQDGNPIVQYIHLREKNTWKADF
ncbi:WD_REPEATS_REGION domain-containing protein [Mortierella sp. GBA39]|nr:WD_REPEATS_REGION domain-containing protein [Mortierella sp. GBA39]